MKSKVKRPVGTPNPGELGALMEKWPASWAGLKDDEPPGRKLLAELRPFVIHLIEQGLSQKTVRRHVDNLWAIGGEVVRRFNDEPELRHWSARKLLLEIVGAGEAPLLPGAIETEQRAADASARKLLNFLLSITAPAPS